MVLGVGSEHIGRLQQLLQTQILEDSLGEEEVQLGVEASIDVVLHQHLTTTLTILTLEEVLTRLGILLTLPQTISNVLRKIFHIKKY